MDLKFTHIIAIKASNLVETLYRASDGMLQGEVQENVCVFGENPSKRESRVFVDHESAVNYLRTVVARLTAETPIFDERDLEERIIQPQGSHEMFRPGISSPMSKAKLMKN